MNRRFLITLAVCLCSQTLSGAQKRPNVILVMADDQGWGQVGYKNHPQLKTPNLDAMARAGIRFDRFYAAGPVCSPTRASVLTGRTHNRTGVPSHGHNLCLQEKTLPQALKNAGYATGHFGKWHLNGIRGPGVPILKDDANHPGRYGFEEWISVTNFFDTNPIMSRKGQFEEFQGDSSVVIVDEAIKFIRDKNGKGKPFFAVIWYGSPHSPMRAVDQDLKGLSDDKLGNHLGEIVGIDRSIGRLRDGLREIGIEKETLVWYCSDNGGLTVDPDSCGGLRGNKGDVYEGGIRVPGIIEWPGHIKSRVTSFPASTMDIMPTLVDLLGLSDDSMLSVVDGQSLKKVLNGNDPKKRKAIPFYFQRKAALIDGQYKIVSTAIGRDNSWELYNLESDNAEKKNIAEMEATRFQRMKSEAIKMLQSVDSSANGKDYPEGKIVQKPRRAFWFHMEEYKPYFEDFFKRPEYAGNKNKAIK